MKVMVMVKASASSEAGKMPSEALLTAMGEFNAQLVDAGVMESGEGLKPSSEGYRVHFNGSERTVSQGPFAATNELVAGFWVWNVSSMEEALEWVKKCPNPMEEASDIEIRALYGMEDFADADPSGEIAAQEDELRQTLEMQKSSVRNYLFFAGRCQEALDFYTQHLGAKVEFKMHFNESPEPMPADMLQKGFENKIMHAAFKVGDVTILAMDGCNDTDPFSGFSLALTVPNETQAHRVFNALAQDGKVVMPLAKVFWSPLYGQVTDKFGVAWMIMLPEA